MSQQQFRYLACGGFMAVLDVLTFTLLNNYAFHKTPVHVLGITIQSHVASIWFLFPVGMFISYLLSRYVVFDTTRLKQKTSIFRYTALVIACQVLNYLLIKFFIEICVFNDVLSKILCTLLIAGFSYLVQKFFAFKTTAIEPEAQ